MIEGSLGIALIAVISGTVLESLHWYAAADIVSAIAFGALVAATAAKLLFAAVTSGRPARERPQRKSKRPPATGLDKSISTAAKDGEFRS